ncbi:GNAT family N-acetyltransferase [Asanoa sp. NPDC049518]|uniref:GNAT family N-acetyltransferase n=1 Tax=unclassified Asanoa TaxID=2685164 RepID=UPI00343730B3
MTDELLIQHDRQVRGTLAARLPKSWNAVWDGPVLLAKTPFRSMAFAQDLDDLSVADLDALIARVRDRGETVEWKTYGHDRPDLVERLRLAGFVPEDQETVLVGLAADLTGAGEAPDGVSIRETTDPADLRRIGAMESEVWGIDLSSLADDLRDRIEATPDDIVVFVAEAGGEVVSAAWMPIFRGTEFAGLWGGSTLAAWRRMGIYRALVARRARVATDRGIRYLMVDASDDSRPILQRLGLRAVTTTTPWVWTPAD